MRILISSNPTNLRNANPDVTVEAEYGGAVVEGRVLTLAHHGERGNNPPPSTRPNETVEGAETIGISHVDLDTLGGILSVAGEKPEVEGFWEMAGFIDLHGSHRLSESGASEENVRRLYAYLAGEKPVYPPKDGSVADVTDQIESLTAHLQRCLADVSTVLEAGDEYRANEEAANLKSFLRIEDGIIYRSSTGFVNNLYTTPYGEIGRAVVTHNPTDDIPFGSITISVPRDRVTVRMNDLVQTVFPTKDEEGKFLAGGHANIAGSERGIVRPASDADLIGRILAFALDLEDTFTA